MSLNEQFNQQYDDMIETVKSRALWRVGERIDEGEAFRCHCPNCGFESLHQRFDITRHRLVFGRSIRAMEAPRPMLRCRRCGHQRHLRDVAELVVPSTIVLHDALRDAAIEHVSAATGNRDGAADPTKLPTELTEHIVAFREEASGPVRQQLLSTVAGAPAADGTTGDALEAIGRALYLSTDQIDVAISDQSAPDTD